MEDVQLPVEHRHTDRREAVQQIDSRQLLA
jgi:hypothetical protein